MYEIRNSYYYYVEYKGKVKTNDKLPRQYKGGYKAKEEKM